MMNEREVEEKEMSRWRGGGGKEEEGKEGEGHSKYSPEDSWHTLWVSKVSLSAAAGVTEMKTMEIK